MSSSSAIGPDFPFGTLEQTEYQELKQENLQLIARMKELFSYLETLNYRIRELRDESQRQKSELNKRIADLENFVKKPHSKEIHDPFHLLQEKTSKRQKTFDPDELSLPSVSSSDPEKIFAAK